MTRRAKPTPVLPGWFLLAEVGDWVEWAGAQHQVMSVHEGTRFEGTPYRFITLVAEGSIDRLVGPDADWDPDLEQWVPGPFLAGDPTRWIRREERVKGIRQAMVTL